MQTELQAEQIQSRLNYRWLFKSSVLSLITALLTFFLMLTLSSFFKTVETRQRARALEQRSDIALKQLAAGEEIQGLLLAMQSAQELRKLISDPEIVEQYPATSPAMTLQVILDNIRQHSELNIPDAPVVIAFAPDGQQFAFSDPEGVIQIRSLAGKQLARFQAEPVISINFSSDGQYLAIASLKGSIRIWNVVAQRWAPFAVRQPGVINVSFNPDDQSVHATSFNGFINRWDLTAQRINQLNLNQTIDVSATKISPEALLGSLCGYYGYRPLTKFVQKHHRLVCRLLELEPNTKLMPSSSTFRRIFQQVDAQVWVDSFKGHCQLNRDCSKLSTIIPELAGAFSSRSQS